MTTEATVAHVHATMERAASAHAAHDEHARRIAVELHRDSSREAVTEAVERAKGKADHGR